MTRSIEKTDLYRELGYGPPFDRLERALEAAGLSRPDKTGIAPAKRGAVEDLLSGRFVAVCSRGDCQSEASSDGDGRAITSAATQADCAVCGGSANARAVDRMVGAWAAAGLRRLCVVGGSPNTRTELDALIGNRLDVRLVDGVGYRNRGQADADIAWADRVAIWGGTQLDHRVSELYRGPHVVQMAKRSIGELAREMARSVEGAGWALRPPAES